MRRSVIALLLALSASASAAAAGEDAVLQTVPTQGSLVDSDDDDLDNADEKIIKMTKNGNLILVIAVVRIGNLREMPNLDLVRMWRRSYGYINNTWMITNIIEQKIMNLRSLICGGFFPNVVCTIPSQCYLMKVQIQSEIIFKGLLLKQGTKFPL